MHFTAVAKIHEASLDLIFPPPLCFEKQQQMAFAWNRPTEVSLECDKKSVQLGKYLPLKLQSFRRHIFFIYIEGAFDTKAGPPPQDCDLQARSSQKKSKYRAYLFKVSLHYKDIKIDISLVCGGVTETSTCCMAGSNGKNTCDILWLHAKTSLLQNDKELF